MNNKDNTFLIIGVFLTIVILFIMGWYVLLSDISAQDILYSILVICILDGLCFLAHWIFNIRK